jgi:spore germination protein GerM
MAQVSKDKKKVSSKKPTQRRSRSSNSSTSGKKKRVSRSAKSKGVSEKTPMYALAIMVLVTVIILLVNRLLNEGDGIKKRGVVSSNETVNLDNLRYRGLDEKKEDTAIENDRKYDNLNTDKKALSEKLVKIYLIKFNEKTEKISLAPVRRRVNSDFPLREALQELIKGPTKSERGRGLLSAVPRNLQILDIQAKNRIAVINFNGAIEEDANGSILLNRIDQIVFTATQFEMIDSVKIKINGEGKKFLGSDGLSIGGSLYRRRM